MESHNIIELQKSQFPDAVYTSVPMCLCLLWGIAHLRHNILYGIKAL